MNRFWKYLRTTLWVGVVAAVVYVGVLMFAHSHENRHHVAQQGQQWQQQEQQQQQGSSFYGREDRGGEHGHEHHDGFGGFFGFLGGLILLVIGWKLWKRWSRNRQPRLMASDFIVAEQTYTTSTVDILDEWEAKTRRELKNKDQEEEQ